MTYSEQFHVDVVSPSHWRVMAHWDFLADNARVAAMRSQACQAYV